MHPHSFRASKCTHLLRNYGYASHYPAQLNFDTKFKFFRVLLISEIWLVDNCCTALWLDSDTGIKLSDWTVTLPCWIMNPNEKALSNKRKANRVNSEPDALSALRTKERMSSSLSEGNNQDSDSQHPGEILFVLVPGCFFAAFYRKLASAATC